MAADPGTDKTPPFLGGFASILSLVGITLFFSGWIYRWAYYAYFSLNLNDQSFSAQSYVIVPIQIYLGTPFSLLKTLLLLLLLPLLITATLAVLNRLAAVLAQLPSRLPWMRTLLVLQEAPTTRLAESRRFLASLLDELVIVGWVLIVLFWFSQHQGYEDARRDAMETTSTLPVVSLVLPQRDGILAQDLRQLSDSGEAIPDPPLGSHVLLGDLELAREVRNSTLSDTEAKQVWRLLNQEPTGWLYMIRTLPPDAKADDRPLIIAVPNAKRGQTLVLSPSPPEPVP
jgi:uncharacterized membrane protein